MLLCGGEKPQTNSETDGDGILQPDIVEEISGTSPPIDFNGWSPLRASFVVDGYHDDNIFLNPPSLALGDYVWEMVPKLSYESSRPDTGKRNYLLFDYDPQLLRYAEFSAIDADNHRGFIRYRYNGSKVEAGFDRRAAQFSGTQRELEDATFDTQIDTDTGRRTEGTRYYTNAFADLELSGATFLKLSATRLSQDFDTPGLVASEDTWGETYLVHHNSPKTQSGIGSKFGRFDSEGPADTDYAQALGLIDWAASQKLAFALEGGVDFRTIETPVTITDLTTPVFRAGADWSPTDSTTFSLDAYQQMRSSVNGESVQQSGMRGGLHQRLLTNFHYTLRGGFEKGRFELLELDLLGNREDEYVFVSNALDYKWRDWGSVGIFHEFRRNESNRRSNFTRNQIGFRITIEK